MFATRPYQHHNGLFGYNQPNRGPRPAFNNTWAEAPQAPCCGAYEYPGAAPCACSPRPQPSFGAYHGYDQPLRYDAPPQEYGYGSERRGPHPHHHGHHGPHGFRHPHHHHPQHEHRASLAEAELEARLAEERLALLKLEHELKRKEAQLKARERELQLNTQAQQVPGAFIDLTFRASPEPAKPKPAVRQCKRVPTSNGCGFTLNPLGGGEREPRPYAQSWSDFWPHLLAQAQAESQAQAQAPAKPQPKMQKPQPKPQPQRPAAQAQGAKHPFEDTLKMLILQSLRPEGSKREQQTQNARKQQEAPAKAKPAPKPAPTPAPAPAPKQEEQKPKPAASTSPKLAAEGSLIEQLKSRYEKDGEDAEVRDTIQAVFNSLLLNHVKQQPASSSAPTSSAAASSSGAPKQQATQETAIADTTSATTGNVNTKGKGKARAASPEGSAPASSADINAALERVSRIETTFQRLAADFTFPSHLDFINHKPTTPSNDHDGYDSDSSSSSTATFPHLAFTARNHAVRYYEQTLSALLQELDLVESWGSEEVRRRRKAVVGLVEEAIGEVEGEVEGRWRSWSAKQEAAGQVDGEKVEGGAEEGDVKATKEVKEPAPQVEDAPVEESATTASEPEPEVQGTEVVVDAEVEHTAVAESEAEVVPEVVPEIPSAEELSSVESQVPESTESTPDAPSDIHTPELIPTDTPTSTVTEEDEYLHADSNNSEAGEETFLLADSQSTVTADELKNKKEEAEKKRASVEVEDLGSDWSELDA
ncbi:hypothetical protein DFP72DRAFT_1164245 [Ephemerocybe angulata]|uniref:BAG domain-containing protein n=1 Tax=Ephemerocybe angulata TaxID=980116 RepID=A0A8H6IF54_9AGAR|nr:hypothetical protein DFP72DRAFT_1164245 [Tulosesus angulatus]